jgi:4-coumarate--CoA ligase
MLAKSLEILNTQQDDILLCFSSIYWLSGLLLMSFGTLSNTTRIITNETVTPELALRILGQYKVTIFFSPPSQLSSIVHCSKIETTDLTHLKTYMCGGSMVSTVLQEKIKKYIPNGKVMVGYGMTEISGIVSANYPKQRFGSVGGLTGGVEVKIINENNVQLGTGESGEIWLRSLYYFSVG